MRAVQHGLDDLDIVASASWIDGTAATHPSSANWALAAMSSVMKPSERLGLRPEDSNPCRGLRRRESGF